MSGVRNNHVAGSRKPSVEQMRTHVMGLLEEFEIIYTFAKRGAAVWGAFECWEVCIRPIKSVGTYATALHEIGHILGRHRSSRSKMVRERDAWRWAKTHALIWTACRPLKYDADGRIKYWRGYVGGRPVLGPNPTTVR